MFWSHENSPLKCVPHSRRQQTNWEFLSCSRHPSTRPIVRPLIPFEVLEWKRGWRYSPRSRKPTAYRSSPTSMNHIKPTLWRKWRKFSSCRHSCAGKRTWSRRLLERGDPSTSKKPSFWRLTRWLTYWISLPRPVAIKSCFAKEVLALVTTT